MSPGPGCKLGNAEQIFDAFFTTKPQGSGMGLAISKSIVESKGGRIWAEGDNGRGAARRSTSLCQRHLRTQTLLWTPRDSAYRSPRRAAGGTR
jgi:signal transduction histidine kinase